MPNDPRSRHAFHNTYGDKPSDDGKTGQFPHQRNQPFPNRQSPARSPFPNPSSGTSTFRSSGSGEGTFVHRNTSAPGQFPSSKVVSSPFTPSHSAPSNPVLSPFASTSTTSNHSLPGVFPYQVSTSATTYPFGPDYGSHGTDSAPPNAPFGQAHSQNLGGAPVHPPTQSQPKDDRSRMYLEGKLDPNAYPPQGVQTPSAPLVNPGLYTQNPNAVYTTTLDPRMAHQNQPASQPGYGQPGYTPQGIFSPIPGQLGAQLTKFGEIYNQRLHQIDDDNTVDPPLLEELGINPLEIYNHLMPVILPKKGNQQFLGYNDLSGPLLLFVGFAMAMVFSGKICFSIIYVLSVFCTVAIYLLFNLMNNTYISLSKTVTILGYSLLPICLTPVIWLFFRFVRILSIALVYVCVLWSTVSASYLFQVELNLDGRFSFIVYPIFLYYAAFANIVIY